MNKWFIGLLISMCPILAFAATSAEYYKAGCDLYGQKQYDKAVLYLKAAVKLDPQYWQAYQVLGQAYYAAGDKVDSLTALQTSLEIHPDNPELQSFTHRLSTAGIDAKSISGSAPSKTKPSINPALANGGVFFRQSFGLGYAPSILQSASQIAANDFLSQNPNPTTNSYTASYNWISSFEDELGYSLDPYNAISFSWSYFINGDQGTSASSSNGSFYTNSGTETGFGIDFTPVGFSLGLNYILSLPDNDGKWFGKVGLAYYLVHIDYTTTNNSYSFPAETYTYNSVITQGLDGSTVGGSLELGREFILFWIIGLDFSIKTNYAVVGQMTGSYSAGSGKRALATASDGALTLVDNSQVGQNGFKYASIDLFSVIPRLSIDVHF